MTAYQTKSALKQLGRDIETARKKRRMSVADFCQRIGVSDKTLKRLETGDGGVRVETLATALLAPGMLDRMRDLVDPATDETALSLDISRLPKRIRSRKEKPATRTSFTPVDENDEGTAF